MMENLARRKWAVQMAKPSKSSKGIQRKKKLCSGPHRFRLISENVKRYIPKCVACVVTSKGSTKFDAIMFNAF